MNPQPSFLGAITRLKPSFFHGFGGPRVVWLKNKTQPLKGLHSLKLTAKAHENRPKPKRKRESIPTIHFQVLLLLVSERVIQLMLTLFPTILEVEVMALLETKRSKLIFQGSILHFHDED